MIIYNPIQGTHVPLEDVSAPVFAQKMMGDGLAVLPSGNVVVSPVDGTILSTFPTKHAIGLKTESGIEVLVHMGIDTVELDGEGFEVFVKEGQEVKAGDKLATMNLEAVKKAGKDTVIMVVFTNLTDQQTFELTQTDHVTTSTEIGKIK